MSTMTDFLENALIDHLWRTTSYTPPATLYFGLLTSAPNDAGAGTEVSGGAYDRVAVTKADAEFAATSGTDGLTSNVNAITFPAPVGANWGTVTHMAVFDAASAGNMLFYATLDNSRVVNDGNPAPVFNAGDFDFTFGGPINDYLENELIKHIFRTGTFTPPASWHFALLTSAPNDAGGGTEVTGGAYARAEVTRADAEFAATSGTDGLTSNVNAITFPAPVGANWGTATHLAVFDAASAGNMVTYLTLTTPRTINDGDPAHVINPGDFTFTLN